MSVKFLAKSVPYEPEIFAGTSGFYPIDRTSIGVLENHFSEFSVLFCFLENCLENWEKTLHLTYSNSYIKNYYNPTN